MNRFSFVVLHYKAKDVTLACVRSILNLDSSSADISVVVVENGSGDGIEAYLRAGLVDSDLSGLAVIVSDDNLGFAKGNDVGFAYARERLDPDFIVVANNDIVFNQKDMCACIARIGASRPFDVLGPDIYNPILGIHQSPGDARMPVTMEYIDDLKRSFQERLDASYSDERMLALKYRLMATAPGRIIRKAKLSSAANRNGWNRPQEGVELQGSCVIFSKRYAQRFEWAFYPATFMYLEELISLFVSQVNGLTHIYDPSVKVCHMHGISTALDYPNEIEKHRFFLKENLKSVEVLQGLVNNDAGECGE